MSFLSSYKRLDNLCRDLFKSEKGVTAYISCMEQVEYPYLKSAGFDSDYKMLKHYRYMRNQIAHDNYAEEVAMCTENDIVWIEQFHQKIINRTDPLALYDRAVRERQQPVKPQKTTQSPVPQVTNKRTSNTPAIVFFVFLTVIGIAAISFAILSLLSYRG